MRNTIYDQPSTSLSLQCPLIINDRDYPEDQQYETYPLHYATRPRKRKTYHPSNIRQIQIVYIIAVVIWFIIIFFFGFYTTNLIGWIILIIPVIVFGINFFNVTTITKDVEDQMLKGNFLSFAFLITIILINWSKIEDKAKYFKILLIALIFLMLSLIDVWVKPENISLVKHIKSVFYTFSLTLLVYGLYIYYVELIQHPPDKPTENSFFNWGF